MDHIIGKQVKLLIAPVNAPQRKNKQATIVSYGNHPVEKKSPNWTPEGGWPQYGVQFDDRRIMYFHLHELEVIE